MKTCNNCANYKPKHWTAQANAQQWRGDNAASLTQITPPLPKPSRSKSLTRLRLEQSLVLGMCVSGCALSIDMSGAIGTIVAVASTTFVLSVVFGKDNQEVVFRLLDRNKDGKLNTKDIEHAVNAVLDNVLEPDESHTPIQSTTENVVYGLHVTRRMPDGKVVLAVILPEYPGYNVKEKFKQCARLYFDVTGNENFSQRQCGAPFKDDNISQVQNELERLGYIAKQGKANNAPRKWTAEGERWLKRFLS